MVRAVCGEWPPVAAGLGAKLGGHLVRGFHAAPPWATDPRCWSGCCGSSGPGGSPAALRRWPSWPPWPGTPTRRIWAASAGAWPDHTVRSVQDGPAQWLL